MAKTFTKFGLKRDLNLADIPDKKIALNNILDELRGGKESFTWEDIEVLKNISLTTISKSTFTNAANATVKKVSSNGTLQIYEPLITLENRFDKAYFTTSEPFFSGGDGLTAEYYDNDAIIREIPGNPSSAFTGFDINAITKTDNFWEQGNFVYGNKIILELLSLYGGVKWEGYFKPSSDGLHTLRITSGGFIKVEFDDLTESREFTFNPGTGSFDYNNYNFNRMNVLVDQTRLNSSDLPNAVIVGTSSKLGESRSVDVSLGSLSKWEAYKIRITYFIDEQSIPEDANISKSIDINISDPADRTFNNINYKRLFTRDYFQNYDIGDFRAFIENSISRSGTEIGLQGTVGDVEGTYTLGGVQPEPGDSYRNVTNFNPIVSYHEFPNSIAEVQEVVDGCSITQFATNIKVDNNEPNSTERIEVGNYVFGPGIQIGTRVTKVVINDSIEIYPVPVISTPNAQLTFVNHTGLVGYGVGVVSSTNVTSIVADYNKNDFKNDQILLSDGLSVSYTDERQTPATNKTATGKLISKFDGTTITFR
jgi:hypothetical protein